MTRRSTAWRATALDRYHRGKYISVEHGYLNDVLGWLWHAPGVGSGQAKTLAAAQRAAERAVDAAFARAKGAG